LAREYLKDVTISSEQLKYLVIEALRGGCQVNSLQFFLYLRKTFCMVHLVYVRDILKLQTIKVNATNVMREWY